MVAGESSVGMMMGSPGVSAGGMRSAGAEPTSASGKRRPPGENGLMLETVPDGGVSDEPRTPRSLPRVFGKEEEPPLQVFFS